MKKVFLKVIIILIMILAMQCIQFNFNAVFAADPDVGKDLTTSDILGGKIIEDYNPHPEDNPTETKGEFDTRVGSILGIVKNLGIVVSVVSLMVIGVKTMVLSVEEKAAYKQALPGYILGAIMVFVITYIPNLIYELVKDANI